MGIIKEKEEEEYPGEFATETSRAHCINLDTETGEIFATLKIKKSDFELRN